MRMGREKEWVKEKIKGEQRREGSMKKRKIRKNDKLILFENYVSCLDKVR